MLEIYAIFAGVFTVGAFCGACLMLILTGHISIRKSRRKYADLDVTRIAAIQRKRGLI